MIRVQPWGWEDARLPLKHKVTLHTHKTQHCVDEELVGGRAGVRSWFQGTQTTVSATLLCWGLKQMIGISTHFCRARLSLDVIIPPSP